MAKGSRTATPAGRPSAPDKDRVHLEDPIDPELPTDHRAAIDQGAAVDHRQVSRSLDRLARLLPNLEDHYAEAWASSPPLPSAPVAMASFRHKSQQALLAVACESGLLWVSRADSPDGARSLQAPGIGPGRGQVVGLWASKAVRPFGSWSELLLLVEQEGGSEQELRVYRAQVRARGQELELWPITERDDGALTGLSEWRDFSLPSALPNLDVQMVRFAAGVDPLEAGMEGSPLERVRRLSDGTQAAVTRTRTIWVEGGYQLGEHSSGSKQVLPKLFDRTVRSLVAIGEQQPEHPSRALVLTDGRSLEGLAMDTQSWHRAWSQSLEHLPLVLDSSIDTQDVDGWPDLFVGLDDRRVVRLHRLPAGKLRVDWQEEVKALERAAGLRDSSRWSHWCREQFERESRGTEHRGRKRRQVLHLLLVEQALTHGVGPEVCSTVRELVQQEPETDLLEPAAIRLQEALGQWEANPPGWPGVPDLVWAFYEPAPYAAQERFDAHLRSVAPSRIDSLRGKSPGYDQLLENHTNMLVSFLPEDRLRLAGTEVLRAIERFLTASFTPPSKGFDLRHLAALQHAGVPHVAAVGARELRLYRFRGVELEELEAARTELQPLVAVHFVRVIGLGSERQALILGDRQGKLALWQANSKGEGRLTSMDLGGDLTDAVALPTPNRSGAKLLVARLVQRQAELTRIRVDPKGRFRRETSFSLGRRRIEAVSCFQLQGRIQVQVAEGNDVLLFSGDLLGKSGELALEGGRSLGSAVRALWVDQSDPSQIPLTYVGTRDGQVFCLRPDASLPSWRRMCWIYQVRRGVAALMPGPEPGTVALLSTSGQLVLLDNQGKKLFSYQPSEPAEAALGLRLSGGAQRRCLVVGSESGRLVVLQESPAAQNCLDKALASLREIESDPREEEFTVEGEPPPNEAAELGWLLARFHRRNNPLDLYSQVRFRISKHATACLLGWDSNAELVTELVQTLSYRDLGRLLRELGGERGPWLRAVPLRLFQYHTRLSRAGQERPAAMVLYEVLRLAKEEGTPIPLRALPADLLGEDWVAFMVAQDLAASLEVESPHEALEPMLEGLLSFPPRVAHFAAAMLAGSPETTQLVVVLSALSRLGAAVHRQQASSSASPEFNVALTELAEALKPWQDAKGGVGLLTRFVQQLGWGAQEHAEDGQRSWSRLVRFIQTIRKDRKTSTRLRPLLFEHIARWLPEDWPGPSATMAERVSALRKLRARADLLEHRSRDERFQGDLGLEESESPWTPVAQELRRRGRKLLRQLSQLEEEYLHTRAWVHLELAHLRRLGAQRLDLEVRARPESLRRIEDLVLEVSLNGQEGLVRTEGGALEVHHEWASVDPGHPPAPAPLRFKGLLPPNQAEVVLRCTVEQGEVVHRFEQRLVLPDDRPRRSLDEAQFAEAFPVRTRELLKQIQSVDRGSLLVLLDRSLGRNSVLQQLPGAGTRMIDLDRELADVGPGRRYPDLLNLERVLRALRGEDAQDPADPSPLGDWQSIVVTNCDELWSRLLSHPRLQPACDQLLVFLDKQRAAKPPLIFFVDSHLGERMAQRRSGRWPMIRAYRLPPRPSAETRGPGGETGGEGVSMWNEATNWLNEAVLGEKTISTETAPGVLETLGGDLRLTHLLRQSMRRDSKIGLGPQVGGLLQSPAAREVLQTELYGLPALAIQLLMVAACSTTTLRFQDVQQGMVAAESVRSSRRDSGQGRLLYGKKLFDSSTLLDSYHVRQLSSDLRRNERKLRVEGFLRGGAVSVSPGIKPWADLIGTDAQSTEAERLLVRRNCAASSGGVLRALPPYRTLLKSIAEGGTLLTEVYQHLTGERSPLAGQSLSALGGLMAAKLLEIDPGLKPEQAQMLHRLGTVVHQVAEGKSVTASELQLALSTLTGTRAEVLLGESAENTRWRRYFPGPRDWLVRLSARVEKRARRSFVAIYARREEKHIVPRPDSRLLDELAVEAGEERSAARLLVLRPGQPAASNPEGWVELSDQELRDVAIVKDWQRALWAMVGVKAGGLLQLAPFQDGGALPAGSPVFFGRSTEQDYILENIRQQSILIVGSRQVGKSSLKNQLIRRLEARDDLQVIELNLQGYSKRRQLLSMLRKLSGIKARENDVRALFDRLAERARAGGKLAVFVLDEIDDLLLGDPKFFWHLRGLHEENQARFLMVGYLRYAAVACSDPNSAFYSWPSAPGGRKYFTPVELDEEAARRITDLLEQPPLSLVWEEGHRERGVQLLLERSYRLPLLVQRACKRLVERLEKQGRHWLRLDDVEAVAAGLEPPFDELLGSVDAERLVPELPATAGSDLVRLILAVATQRLYFDGDEPPIEDENLAYLDPESLSFTSDDLLDWLMETFRQSLLASEAGQAIKIVKSVDLRQLLVGLSLTLVLSTSRSGKSYFFQIHLYPRELKRRMAAGESIDDKVLGSLADFARHLGTGES